MILDLGGTVEPVPSSGDIKYRHPLVPRQVVHNCRRKSASQYAQRFVRDILKAQAAIELVV